MSLSIKREKNRKRVKKFIQNNTHVTFEEFLNETFIELKIPIENRQKLTNTLLNKDFDKFDKQKSINLEQLNNIRNKLTKTFK